MLLTILAYFFRLMPTIYDQIPITCSFVESSPRCPPWTDEYAEEKTYIFTHGELTWHGEVFEGHGTELGGERAHPAGIGTADPRRSSLHVRNGPSTTPPQDTALWCRCTPGNGFPRAPNRLKLLQIIATYKYTYFLQNVLRLDTRSSVTRLPAGYASRCAFSQPANRASLD